MVSQSFHGSCGTDLNVLELVCQAVGISRFISSQPLVSLCDDTLHALLAVEKLAWPLAAPIQP